MKIHKQAYDTQFLLRAFVIIFILLQLIFVAIYTSRNPGIIEALKFNFWYAILLSLITTLYLALSNKIYYQRSEIQNEASILEVLRRNTIRGVKIKETEPQTFHAGFGYLSAPVHIKVSEQEIQFTGPKPFIYQLMEVLEVERE